jgi:chaperone modulatory protein CbpM
MTFRDVDVARVRLIVDIRDDLGLPQDSIPVVLSLIDQVHGLRHELRRLAAAVAAQPAEVRTRIRRAAGARHD